MLPTIACPTCRKPISLPEQYAGAVVNCPHCANALTVPQLHESPTAPVVLPARSGGQAVAASAFEDMSEQKLSSTRYRAAKQGGVPTLAIVLGVMFLAIIVGVLIYQQVDANNRAERVRRDAALRDELKTLEKQLEDVSVTRRQISFAAGSPEGVKLERRLDELSNKLIARIAEIRSELSQP